MVHAKKIMIPIFCILLLSLCGFSQQNIVYYSDSLLSIVSIDSATAVDTTEYSTNMIESNGRRPSKLYVTACISDSVRAIETPTNTAVVTVWGYSASRWWFIAEWDKNSDYGSWMKYIDNFSFSNIRFITTSNTRHVDIAIQLTRTR